MEHYLEIVTEKAKEVFMREDLSGATRFTEDLAAKSLSIAQLMNVLEDEFDIEIPYMGFKRCATLAEAAEYIRKLDEE